MNIYMYSEDMPQKCGQCPCFHAERQMYCQAVKPSKDKRIVAPYGLNRPDWCPLVEIEALKNI